MGPISVVQNDEMEGSEFLKSLSLAIMEHFCNDCMKGEIIITICNL